MLLYDDDNNVFGIIRIIFVNIVITFNTHTNLNTDKRQVCCCFLPVFGE